MGFGDMSGKEQFLTKEQLDALVSALPGCTSRHRRALLPRVLKEWAETDLMDHPSRATRSKFWPSALVLIENKLDNTGRDVTWQALKYVSYCSGLSKEQIRGIFGPVVA
jgi:hypothetical protein